MKYLYLYYLLEKESLMFKKTFSYNYAFRFGLGFIKNNISIIGLLFIFHLILEIIDSIRKTIKLEYFYNSALLKNIFPYSVQIPNIKLFGLIPLNVLVIALLYFYVIFSSLLIALFCIKTAISWHDNSNVDLKEILKSVFSFSLIFKVIYGFLLIFGISSVVMISSFIVLYIPLGLFPGLLMLLPSFVSKYCSYFFSINAVILIFVSGIISICFCFRYILSIYIIIDKNLKVSKSLNLSELITESNRWKIFGIMLMLSIICTVPYFLIESRLSKILISPINSFLLNTLILSLNSAVFSTFNTFSMFYVYKQLSENNGSS